MMNFLQLQYTKSQFWPNMTCWNVHFCQKLLVILAGKFKWGWNQSQKIDFSKNSTFTAIITDVSTLKTRQKGMALIGIAFSIGFLVGPMVGAGTFPQCGNFENLLPCRFYVKSILAKFRRSKNDILTILLALNFDFT